MIFPDFVIFPTRSVITPLVYIWVNIDPRGHAYIKKSKKIAVGPKAWVTLGHRP